MTEFKGTKGKWKSTNEGIYGGIDNYQQIKAGCEYYDNLEPNLGFSISGYISRENALLILKAPEMLELLIEVSRHHQGGHSEIGHKIKLLIEEATELKNNTRLPNPRPRSDTLIEWFGGVWRLNEKR